MTDRDAESRSDRDRENDAYVGDWDRGSYSWSGFDWSRDRGEFRDRDPERDRDQR